MGIDRLAGTRIGNGKLSLRLVIQAFPHILFRTARLTRVDEPKVMWILSEFANKSKPRGTNFSQRKHLVQRGTGKGKAKTVTAYPVFSFAPLYLPLYPFPFPSLYSPVPLFPLRTRKPALSRRHRIGCAKICFRSVNGNANNSPTSTRRQCGVANQTSELVRG